MYINVYICVCVFYLLQTMYMCHMLFKLVQNVKRSCYYQFYSVAVCVVSSPKAGLMLISGIRYIQYLALVHTYIQYICAVVLLGCFPHLGMPMVIRSVIVTFQQHPSYPLQAIETLQDTHTHSYVF